MAMIEINLLPREMRRRTGRLALPKSAAIGTGVAAVIVVGLIGLTGYQSMRWRQVQAEIDQAQAKVDGMKNDIALVDRLTDVKKNIMKRMEAIETLDRDRGEWVTNLEDVLAIVPDYLWLSGFRRDDSRARQPGRNPADTTTAPQNEYVFDGYCYSVSSLANLILNMQDSPRFTKPALRRAQLTDVKGRKVYEFSVSCLLEPVGKAAEGIGDERTRKLGHAPAVDSGATVSVWDQAAEEGDPAP